MRKDGHRGNKGYMGNIKTLISLISFIPLISLAQSEQNVNPNGYNKFYYENGKISSEGNMREGRPDGYWKTYLPNGKMKSEGNRKNFELDSLWKFYDGSGKLLSEINYVSGKKEGVKRYWDPDGFLLSEEEFMSDIKQGFTLKYYPSDDTARKKGKLKFKIPFDKGVEHGIAYEYDKEGKIMTIMDYNYGTLRKQETINRTDKAGQKQGVWKDFHDNGKVKEETAFQNGKKMGYSKTYLPSGSLANIEKYVGDSLQRDVPELTTKLEVRNEYYEDGSIKRTGTWLEGIAEGTHKEYSTEGKVTNAKIYREGSMVGEGLMDGAGNQQGAWTEYHPAAELTNGMGQGKLKAKGVYDNGTRVGEWIFHHLNGKVEQKGKYDKKGKPQGLWQWYYADGTPWREENYLNGKREGPLMEWNDSGKVITKGEYIDGLKEGKWFYQIQDYREEGVYKSDQKDGPWESYYVENKQVRFAGKFVEGFPDGKHSYYYYDGKLSEEGKYIMGNKNGKWEYYNPDGTILLVITFKNNREVKYDGVKVKPLLPGEGGK